MKLKTKKRLRLLMTPIIVVWVSVAAIMAYAGAFVLSLGLTMLGEPNKAKELIQELNKRHGEET